MSSKCGLGLRDRGSPLGTAWIEWSPAQAEFSYSQEDQGYIKIEDRHLDCYCFISLFFIFNLFSLSLIPLQTALLVRLAILPFLSLFFDTFLYKSFATTPIHTLAIIIT